MPDATSPTETNLLQGDQSMATAAITPASVASSASSPFLSANELGVINPLDDSTAGGNDGSNPSVPIDVYDKNFGANYSILYSSEGSTGANFFDGGLGTDEYTGAQGDPGNFGNISSGDTIAGDINYNNAIGGAPAVEQYNLFNAISLGDPAEAALRLSKCVFRSAATSKMSMVRIPAETQQTAFTS